MNPTAAQRTAAWGVHFYTALGLPLAGLAMMALHWGDARLFFLAQIASTLVDATDGTMARRVHVKDVLPSFNGAKLDDLVDFLNFSFLPAAGMAMLGVFPTGWELLAALPLMASGYGFCQDRAKTDDAFVGFPSYWNVLLLYFVACKTAPWAAAASTVLLSALVFVPLYYVYPSRTKLWMPVTVATGLVWTAMMLAVALHLDAAWARPVAIASLAYPLYYSVLSMVHHRKVAAS